MKKTQWKELLKTIVHSKVTFLSILLFIMMGMLLFLGIDWTSCCIQSNCNKYFNDTNVYDVQITVSPGYKNLDDFLGIKDVSEVEGLYSYITSLKKDNYGFEVSVTSIPKKISCFNNIEGTLPSSKGEVALIRYWAEKNEYKIGDTFKINNEPIFLDQGRLSTDEFKVTAIIDSPLYTAKNTTIFGMSPTRNIPVNATFFIDESSFNETINAVSGYSLIYVKSNNLRNYDYFSNAYYDKLAIFANQIKDSQILKNKASIVTTIRDSMSHQNVQTIAEILGRVKYSMSSLFVGVGLLVSFFSISRMVSETSTTIGIKKAKGFKNKEIYIFYLFYTGISVIFGAILGTLLGRFATETIIVNTIIDALVFPKIKYYISFVPILILFAVELSSQLIITFFATHRILKKRPIELIKNENVRLGKKRFYQKGKIWNKLSLFSKTIINNIVNDRTRVLSMLVGIVGCVSLLTCALTIDRNISGSFEYQFNHIYSFQAVVHYDGDVTNTKRKLEENNYYYDDIMFTYLTLDCPNGKQINAQTYIFNDDNFSDFISVCDSKGNKVHLDDGIYVSFSYKEKFDVNDGASIKLTSTSLKSIETKAKGFFKHYLVNNVILMNSKTYKEKFESEYKPNALLVNLGKRNLNELNNLIIAEPCVSYVCDIYNASKVAFTGITNIFTIVDLVYFILALLMALLVILDLLVMFINEKKNELIILIINGYSKKTVKKYIYFDTIVLSIIGIILGVVLGTFMSDLVVMAFQNETLIFMSGFNLISILIAVSIAIVIIVCITLLALRKINKFKLNDINKL